MKVKYVYNPLSGEMDLINTEESKTNVPKFEEIVDRPEFEVTSGSTPDAGEVVFLATDKIFVWRTERGYFRNWETVLDYMTAWDGGPIKHRLFECNGQYYVFDGESLVHSTVNIGGSGIELVHGLGDSTEKAMSQATVTNLYNQGYKLVGTATPSTTPVTLTGDEKVFYIAIVGGDYSNFGLGNIRELSVIKSDNRSWVKTSLNVPTSIDMVLSLYKGSYTELTKDIELLDGMLTLSGTILSNTYCYHTPPIKLRRGDSLLVQSYVPHSTYPFFITDEDGTSFTPIKDIVPKTYSNTDYNRNNVSIYTALDDCYVSANIYEQGGNIYRIAKCRIGSQLDIWNKFNENDSTFQILNSKIEDVNEHLFPFSFTKGRFINQTGDVLNAPDPLYVADPNFYLLPDSFAITNIRMANNFPIIAFYDKNQNFLEGIVSTAPIHINITRDDYPEGAVYFRIAYYNSITPNINVSPSLLQLKLEDTLKSNKENIPAVKINAFKDNASINAGETLNLPINKVKKNTSLSASIQGFENKVSIGVGYSSNATYLYRTYESHWVEINNTEIKLYAYYNDFNEYRPPIKTYEHNLTLTNDLYISIITNLDKTTLILVTSTGSMFEQELPSWGQGRAFVTNGNTSTAMQVDLSFMIGDITKNIWVFGDSYFSYWIPNLYKMGISNFLNNSQPGSSPEAAYTELQNLINLGYTPSYILWALGMNGNTIESISNGTYVINSYQKTYIDSVKALCDSKGIKVVFVAVPSTPSRQKTGFKAYIESINCRYVDLYDALGCNEYGVWTKSPTLFAWKKDESIVYTLKYERQLSPEDPVFDINGQPTGKLISSVSQLNGNNFTNESTIVVDNEIYTYSSNDSIVGLLGTDSVHPSSPNGACYVAQVFLNEFPELVLK